MIGRFSSFSKKSCFAICSLIGVASPFAAMARQASGKVSGTISCHARIAPPPQAIVRLSLQDVSLTDAPSKEISALEMRPKHQPPLYFTLPYDRRRIDPAHTYALSARIIVDGRLAFISTRMYPVLTRGAPRTVDLVVDPVAERPD